MAARGVRRPILSLMLATGMIAFVSVVPRGVAASDEIVVFAAASLKNALEEAVADWRSHTGQGAIISLASSAALARQIQQGAPADIFISASPQWMDVLEKDGSIDVQTRRNLLGNRLVLIAHGTSATTVEIAPGFDLAGRLGNWRLAMALVDAVPAGIYGKSALTFLGVWPSVQGKVAQVDNVRAALALVARGEAPFGIVYATDAAASDNVTVVGTFPMATHPPIVYAGAVTAASRNKTRALGLLTFCASVQGRHHFERHGFTVIHAASAD